jgi:hypothetical protein
MAKCWLASLRSSIIKTKQHEKAILRMDVMLIARIGASARDDRKST